ncbi:Nesprin-3 [Galemys pyrenaicus]|uniref:Nesprin-3 n=1 Tax=Galemys pyrenaicus TaxID=202257 RepID=A0A8J6A7C2_GALPY|nr:Nesprin-3 [Galemys pyrenaicus]
MCGHLPGGRLPGSPTINTAVTRTGGAPAVTPLTCEPQQSSAEPPGSCCEPAGSAILQQALRSAASLSTFVESVEGAAMPGPSVRPASSLSAEAGAGVVREGWVDPKQNSGGVCIMDGMAHCRRDPAVLLLPPGVSLGASGSDLAWHSPQGVASLLGGDTAGAEAAEGCGCREEAVTGAMTQQPQEGFDRSVQEAREWMKAVQERLQVNDNTQGPRAALEARLRETEKICQLEPEGRVKVDLVLRAAEVLLLSCHDLQKPEILARLRDIKAQWEETVTYMTHCHSRIEWVWLHWSEYLLAQDEFYRWFQKMLVLLEPPVELQLGLKEKQWQLSHAQVLLQNVHNQAVLLDRLLEEAGSLFNRIGDPSVDEDAQKRMKAEYQAVKTKAQDRVTLLEQVAQEHERFQAGVDDFQLWLKAVVDKVHGCLGWKCTLTREHRLSALQDMGKDFARSEDSLKRLEEQAAGVIQNTSPLGAEKITVDLEEMRKVLEKLRVLWEEEQGRLQSLPRSEGARELQVRQLEAELGEFRKDLQKLAEEGREPTAKAVTEDELVARWRCYSVRGVRPRLSGACPGRHHLKLWCQVAPPHPGASTRFSGPHLSRCSVLQVNRAALAAEEPRVGRLQAQLKELMVFPNDLQLLSDSLVAAVQEYQSMKGQSTRLRNGAEVELWQRFQRPLQDLQLWRALAQRLLDVTASLPDLPSIHTFLPQLEAALAESSRLKEQLTMLQLKRDLLGSIFGQERATGLLEQVVSSVRDRDLLHNSLLQRKSKLQGLQEEGLDLGAQVEAARPLIQGNLKQQHKMDQLSADCQALQRELEGLVDACRQGVREHCAFSHKLLELRQWVAAVTQTLESHRGDAGPGDTKSREVQVQALLAEFPEKEAQLALIEAQGRRVMEKSSREGAAAVQLELGELAGSWRALRLLEESLLSLIRNQQLQRTEVDSGKKMVFTNNIPKAGFLINPLDPIPRRRRRANLLQEEGGDPEDFPQLLRNFEQWLQAENSKLVRIIAMETTTAQDVRTRELKLQDLETRVAEGQQLFENLLHLGPGRGTSDELEDLRYRWMLYKSKLKDSSHLLVDQGRAVPGHLVRGRPEGVYVGAGLGPAVVLSCQSLLPLPQKGSEPPEAPGGDLGSSSDETGRASRHVQGPGDHGQGLPSIPSSTAVCAATLHAEQVRLLPNMAHDGPGLWHPRSTRGVRGPSQPESVSQEPGVPLMAFTRCVCVCVCVRQRQAEALRLWSCRLRR